MAPQSRTTKGPSRRLESSWIARAASSFPVPVSPVTITVTSIGAIFRTRPKICLIFTLFPIMSKSAPSRSASKVISSSTELKVRTVLPTLTLEPGTR